MKKILALCVSSVLSCNCIAQGDIQGFLIGQWDISATMRVCEYDTELGIFTMTVNIPLNCPGTIWIGGE